jgi:hypothetical protein
MTTYYAEYCWSLPPEPSTVDRYVEALARAAGHPCRLSHLVQESSTTLDASLSFPRVSDKNLITLMGNSGVLDFRPIPFFWAHAIAAVRELGGTVTRALPPVPSERRAVQWRELKWADRVRIITGFGESVG